MDKTEQTELLESVEFSEWEILANTLTEESERICADNGCTEYNHHCESYAYISAGGLLQDICSPDYWQGWRPCNYEMYGSVAAIPLPWIGNGQDLKAAVDADLDWNFD